MTTKIRCEHTYDAQCDKCRDVCKHDVSVKLSPTPTPWHVEHPFQEPGVYINCHSIVERLAKFDGCYGGGEPMDFEDYRLNVCALVKEAQQAILKAEGK